MGRKEPIEEGATHVFDKAYCDYDWWSRIHDTGASFVTRAKKNARYEIIRQRCINETGERGEGFTILADANVRLGTQGKTRLACPLRHLRIRREDGSYLEIITNDREPVGGPDRGTLQGAMAGLSPHRAKRGGQAVR